MNKLAHPINDKTVRGRFVNEKHIIYLQLLTKTQKNRKMSVVSIQNAGTHTAGNSCLLRTVREHYDLFIYLDRGYKKISFDIYLAYFKAYLNKFFFLLI